MLNNQKGFTTIIWIIALGLIALTGLACWRVAETANINQRTTIAVSKYNPKPPSKTKRIIAVGDIVCDPSDIHLSVDNTQFCQDKAVADLTKRLKPDAILALGDLQYDDGALSKYQNAYDKTWGQFKGKLYPTPGNHEYVTPNADGYYTYFKNAPIDVSKGYYEFKLGDWQIYSLNSNCDKIGGCGPETTQLKWLQEQLNTNKTKCTLAYWHHPRFTSGKYINDAESKNRSLEMWSKLSKSKGEIVLTGHDHLYERFAPQTTLGETDETGIREFVVGTGGKAFYEQKGTSPNSQKVIPNQYGVLVIDLYANAYKWQFVNTANKVLDSGSNTCN